MKRNSEAGQALLTAGLALTVLLLAAGLAIDMGYLRYQKRRMQSAADSAALAGAAELAYSNGAVTSAVTQAAAADAKVSGFDSGNPAVNVATQIPASGPFSGKPGYVEVLIQQNQPTFFMKIFRVNSVSVSARAVAHLGNGRNCLYALGANDPNALVVNGATVLASNCGIVSNGDFTAGGGANINALSIGVAGASNTGGATVVPTPMKSVPAANPLANLPLPNPVGGCVPFAVPPNPFPGPPYCGISITAGNVVFPSGLYIVEGDFSLSGTASVTGIGVTFFVTRGSGGPGIVNFNTTGGTDLQAPRTRTGVGTAPYEGILMIRDPTDPNPPAASLLAGSLQELEGVLYFPTANVTLGANTNNYSIVIANEIVLQGGLGNISMHNDYSLLSDGAPIKGTALAE
ncbi:MAG: pilus assembly protein TadG-related protein [Candidatus Acidiferrales bacterium]